MKDKNLIIIGLVVVIIGLVVAMLYFKGGLIKGTETSKYKTSDDVTEATVDIGSGVENIGSTLEEIDNTLG